MTERWKKLHAAADSIEPRMHRALLKAVQRMRDSVSVNELAMALAVGDREAALRVLPVSAVEEVLGPAGGISRDAVARGGRVGAGVVVESVAAVGPRHRVEFLDGSWAVVRISDSSVVATRRRRPEAVRELRRLEGEL